MSIYTRKGDRGKTSLLNSKNKAWKDSQVIKAIGAVDELNSFLGVVNSETKDYSVTEIIEDVQNDLFDIGSYLADSKRKKIDLGSRIKKFEEEIDDLTSKIPKLSSFILPGGGKVGSKLHFARTIARRCEREAVSLQKKEKFDELVISYLNRLSDLLFTMARFANNFEGKEEKIWKK